MFSTLTRETDRQFSHKALAPWLWRGRAVKLADGTAISMPDTEENQAAFPQPSSQAPGVGFPLARLVMVICLATGAALDMAVGPHSGRGQSLGTRDHLVCWPKPAARPQWMTPEQHAGLPNELGVCEVSVAHRVLVTTLVDHRQVSKDDLSVPCARRWNVELDLRNLKTTAGMDVLNCRTPQMNEKQLWVHLLAYNVIRLLMA